MDNILTFEKFAGSRYVILDKASKARRHLYKVRGKAIGENKTMFIWWNDLSGEYSRVVPEATWCDIDDFWNICVKQLKK